MAPKITEDTDPATEQDVMPVVELTPEQVAEQEKAAQTAFLNELVPITLFKDGTKYKDDVPVYLNGDSILIQRGKTVMIKRKFALVLENSNRQDLYTADVITGLTNEFEAKKNQLT
jgi:hypothetical protein